MKEEVITLRGKLKQVEESMHESRREKEMALNNCRHLEQQLAYERQVYQQTMQRGTHGMEEFREDEEADPV